MMMMILISVVFSLLLSNTFLNVLCPGCCLRFSQRRINPGLIVSYYITDPRCPKTAIILVTKMSRKICVDPSSSWVRNTMKLKDANSP
uniref:C-C motif chemokine n=1 Tax=Oreochromis aureus TaxID=47969 RepID=A0A668RMC0_OREAU